MNKSGVHVEETDGLDTAQLTRNLELSCKERLLRHQSALQAVRALAKAGHGKNFLDLLKELDHHGGSTNVDPSSDTQIV
jgi:hypothetical protein